MTSVVHLSTTIAPFPRRSTDLQFRPSQRPTVPLPIVTVRVRKRKMPHAASSSPIWGGHNDPRFKFLLIGHVENDGGLFPLQGIVRLLIFLARNCQKSNQNKDSTSASPSPQSSPSNLDPACYTNDMPMDEKRRLVAATTSSILLLRLVCSSADIEFFR